MVSLLEALAIVYPVALFLNGSVGIGVKYLQWRKYKVSELLYTFFGVGIGVLGIASSIACFRFEYGDLASRIILLASGIHMALRPLRHKRWGVVLSVIVGVGTSYGAYRYWSPAFGSLKADFLKYFGTELFLEPYQIAILAGLVLALLMFPVFKFIEDALGTTSSFLDHPFVAIPVGILSVVEGVVTGIPPHHSIFAYAAAAIFGAGAASTLTNSTGGVVMATRHRRSRTPPELWWAAELREGTLKGYKAALPVSKRATSLNRALKSLRGDVCSRLTTIQRKISAVSNLLPEKRGTTYHTLRRDACNISRIRKEHQRKKTPCPSKLKASWLHRPCRFSRR